MRVGKWNLLEGGRVMWDFGGSRCAHRPTHLNIVACESMCLEVGSWGCSREFLRAGAVVSGCVILLSSMSGGVGIWGWAGCQ